MKYVVLAILTHSMVTGLGLAVTLHLINTDSPSSASLVFASKVTMGAYKTSKIMSCSPTLPKPFSAVQVYFPARQSQFSKIHYDFLQEIKANSSRLIVE